MGIIRQGFILVAVAAVAMLVSACASNQPSATAAPGPSVTGLWPDVPVFKDSTPDMETNPFFNQTPSPMMEISYYSPRQPAEVAAFYTNDLMKQNGWSPQPYDVVKHFSVGHGQGPQIPTGETSGGCSMFEYQGQPAAVCTFSKWDDASGDIELTIDISLDSKTNQTLIIYTRITGSVVKK